MKVAAIGDATARAVRDQLCLQVDLCPESFVAEALADALEAGGHVKGNKFLLLRADIARPLLRQRLEQGGAAEVRDVAVYETRPAEALPPVAARRVGGRRGHLGHVHQQQHRHAISSSCSARITASKLKGVKVASIGPITTATLHELGLEPTVQADTFNVDGLVAAISEAGRAL